MMNFESRIDLAVLLFFCVSGGLILAGMILKEDVAGLVATNFAVLVIAIGVVELLFVFEMIEHPIVRTNVNRAIPEEHPIVEKLSNSPWYKFRGSLPVKSQGFRGADFVYEWYSDKLGFKNISADGDFDFLALGDSVTEGMGVAIQDTWPTLLERVAGARTYNAGVQGYAPRQFLGALEYLSTKLKFGGIIIGHLPDIYARESKFRNEKNIAKATGGIESIRVGSIDVSGLALAQLLRGFSSYVRVKMSERAAHYDGPFKRYLGEIPTLRRSQQELELDPNWLDLVKDYSKIIAWAEENNKRAILLAIPSRHEVYFDLSTQGLISRKDTQYYLELELLQKAFNHRRLIIVDSFPAFRSYIEHNSPQAELPYFLQDGHLSKRGNLIVANVLRQAIEQEKVTAKD